MAKGMELEKTPIGDEPCRLLPPSGALLIVGLEALGERDLEREPVDGIGAAGRIRTPELWGVWMETSGAVEVHASPADVGHRRWERLSVRVEGRGQPQRTLALGEVLADSAVVLLMDPAAMCCEVDESELVDVRFWGSHGAKVAKKLRGEGCRDLDTAAGVFGWRDVPHGAASRLLGEVQGATRFWYGLRSEITRHTPGYLVERALGQSAGALLTLGGERVAAFRVHQDGSWPVMALLHGDGRVVGLEVDFRGG